MGSVGPTSASFWNVSLQDTKEFLAKAVDLSHV